MIGGRMFEIDDLIKHRGDNIGRGIHKKRIRDLELKRGISIPKALRMTSSKEEMKMFSKTEIKEICRQYNLECHAIGDLIDTSFNDKDQRYNYEINERYFLKINNSPEKTEGFLEDIMTLVDRYKSIGVYSPCLYKTSQGRYGYTIEVGPNKFTCHLEEKAPFRLCPSQEEVDYAFKTDMLAHVGKLASRYTNHNLSKQKSMWALGDFTKDHEGVDEKQENFDDLILTLSKHGEDELVSKLTRENTALRRNINSAVDKLPKCVYQGDLNASNIVIDDHHRFRGVIDFNLFGTEVNINCFLNEAMYFFEKEDFEVLSADEIYHKMMDTQNKLLSSILSHYTLNNDEKEVMKDYKKLIHLSFYPNVKLMIYFLDQKKHYKKVIDLVHRMS